METIPELNQSEKQRFLNVHLLYYSYSRESRSYNLDLSRFTALASVGRTSVFRTATPNQLNNKLRVQVVKSSRITGRHSSSSNFQPKFFGDGS